MPKTAKHLWEEVISWENLIAAYHEARKRKRYKIDVMRFHRRWEEELLNIHNHLVWQSWQPSPFSAFTVYEPKVRLIEAPAFRDRVVHHALHRVVEPYFEARFIHHSYACRRGFGAHRASQHVQRCLARAQQRWGKVYVLQGDISKYFPSIHRERLLEQLDRTIRDPKVMALWSRIVHTDDADHGLPIGALTSQLAGNAYLDVLDHWVQDDMGYTEYARYMDDWVVLGPCKEQMKRLLSTLEQRLGDDLDLRLSKGLVYPASQGVDFAGYRTWATHKLPRRKNVVAARRRLKALAARYAAGNASYYELRQSLSSFLGHIQHADAHRVAVSVVEEVAVKARLNAR
ncbi:reverse transcriptase/maturase family protein [Billgrantia gudaonensis]|uniref:Retron-type reverse transcriptase n=1 Tax=Billgrantia gudaonensis TaxID=376427 RepID=A0A1G9BLN0_9GAMM|nr:reverse transcriptase/maturase family protein [Halomonas gudaonensis]SDK40428.1 Retron-type reverse transcriptase [Halomonas gudaonensis]